MRALLLLLPSVLSACIDDPCRGASGDRVYVYGPEDAHRLDGSDPTAFGSIAEALAAADDGGAICLSRGTWSEVLRLDRPGLQLLGAGPGETVLTAAPQAPDDPVLTLAGGELLVRGLTVERGVVGIAVAPGATARLESLEISDNETGLLADSPGALALDEVDLSRNRWVGADLRAGAADPVVTFRGGRISGNGDLRRSTAGGVRSELDLVLEGVTVRDNAGREVGDLDVAGHLDAWDLELERASASLATAPRIRATDGLELIDSRIATDGAPGIEVSCLRQPVRLENVVFTEAGRGVVQDQLTLRGCSGFIYHSTFVNTGGGSQGAAIALTGGGDLSVANTALVGYDRGVGEARYSGTWRAQALFEGSITEAQLVSPIGPEADVRPQSDSPLLDSGADLGVATDIQGATRPRGGGPDIGAYEY